MMPSFKTPKIPLLEKVEQKWKKSGNSWVKKWKSGRKNPLLFHFCSTFSKSGIFRVEDSSNFGPKNPTKLARNWPVLVLIVGLSGVHVCVILAQQLCWPEHNMTTMLALGGEIPVLATMIDQPDCERRRRRHKQPPGLHEKVGEMHKVDENSQVEELREENSQVGELKEENSQVAELKEEKVGELQEENGKVEEDDKVIQGGAKDRKRQRKEGAKPKAKGGGKIKGEGQVKKKRKKMTVPDDDSDEGGYDDEDGDDTQRKDVDDAKLAVAKIDKCEASKKAYARNEDDEASKKKGGEADTGEADTKKDGEADTKKGKGKGRRDQSKSKKFWELKSSLPESLQSHFDGLSRAQQTAFIHAGIQRSGGHLSLDEGAMFRLVTKKEEQQSGMNQMKGYALEEPWDQHPYHPQTTKCSSLPRNLPEPKDRKLVS